MTRTGTTATGMGMARARALRVALAGVFGLLGAVGVVACESAGPAAGARSGSGAGGGAGPASTRGPAATRGLVAGPAGAVVEAGELAGQMRQAAAGSGAVFLDVRPEAEFLAGHVPGAVRVDPPSWEQDSLAAESGLANERAWHERIGALGIDGDDAVFIADAGGMTGAARVWFILQHFGVTRAAVVNGGYRALTAAAGRGEVSLVAGPGEPAGAKAFAPASGGGAIGLIDRATLRAQVDAGRVQVLDARTRAEFVGDDARGNTRAGHLPAAMSVPHTRFLQADGRLKEPAEIAAILEEAGFVRGRPVIAHCQSGGRASVAALAAARAGYGPVLNYYLSFGDWSADTTCAVVRGE